MLEKSAQKYLFMLLLCTLCSIFLLSHAKELDKWKPLRRNEQGLALKAKEVNVDSLSNEDSAENTFDGIHFKIKNFASNIRSRTQNTIKYFTTKPPVLNYAMLHRNGTEDVLKRPFKRLRTRLKQRRKNKNQNDGLNMEPVNTGTIYEPIQVIDTGLAIIGTAMDPMTMLGNITDSSTTNYTSPINITNMKRN